MEKNKLGKYSNGTEDFTINKIEDEWAFISTDTGVSYLGAKKNSQIKIGEDILAKMLQNDDELKGFRKTIK